MKLSIVIPAYNEADYIGSCLDSIMAEVADDQTLNKLVEIIVVNNACTDQTRSIAERYSKVKIVDQPLKGLVNARAAGFSASQGELIANIDADTILPSGWIKRVLHEFKRHPSLVALSGPQQYYDLPVRINLLVMLFYYATYSVYIINRYVFHIGSVVQGGNFIVKKSALWAAGGYNPAKFQFYGEDADLARRLYQVGEVKFSQKLPIYSSGRRLIAEGVLTMGLRYTLNYFWVIFFKRPFTQHYIDIRATQPPCKRTSRTLARFFGDIES